MPVDKFFRTINDRVRNAISKSARQEGCQWPMRGWDGCEGEFGTVFKNGIIETGQGLILRNCSRLECETVATRLSRFGFVTSIVDAVPMRQGGGGLGGRFGAPGGVIVRDCFTHGKRSRSSSSSLMASQSKSSERAMRNHTLEDETTSSGVPTAWSGGAASVTLVSEIVSLLRSLLFSSTTARADNVKNNVCSTLKY